MRTRPPALPVRHSLQSDDVGLVREEGWQKRQVKESRLRILVTAFKLLDGLMFYFSYAANLNRAHMTRLCPGAEVLFPAVLENYTLTVRRWFNIEPKEGATVQGGVWHIREEHIWHLDRYEDSPELYERTEMKVVADTGTVECLIYLMGEPFAIPLSSPDPEYLEMVRQGYREWGISSDQLEHALQDGA